MVYSFTPPGGTWDVPDTGTYTITLNANEVFDTSGNAVDANSVLNTFTVNIPLDETSLSAPTGNVTATDTLTLEWPDVEGAITYQVDVYNPYQQIFSQEINSSVCVNADADFTGATCSQQITIDSIVGTYTVYIQSRAGSVTSDYTLSSFDVRLGATAITSPTGSVPALETVTVQFDAISGAEYYVIDVYRPASTERYVADASTACTTNCAYNIATNNEQRCLQCMGNRWCGAVLW